MEIHALDLVNGRVRDQRPKKFSQFILREVAIGEFRDAQFDFTCDLPGGRLRFRGKSPSLVVKPISEVLKRSCIAQVSR